MIISLYLLFPIIFWLTKKMGLIFVMGSLLLQIWFYWYLGNIVVHDLTIKSLQTDQQQYVFFLSWIFYFALGIYLGLRDWGKNLWLGIIALPFLSLGLRLTVNETQNLINQGYNIIFASGFTRISVILLSTTGLISGLVFGSRVLKYGKGIFWPVLFFGRNSFLIYLSHTVVLRFLWAFFYQGVPVGTLFIPAIIWGIALLTSVNSAFVRSKVGLIGSRLRGW
jgi:membrane-bound acyltransferase YfiQ involved in biofilm formation